MKITIVGAAGGEVTGSAYDGKKHGLRASLPQMKETISL